MASELSAHVNLEEGLHFVGSVPSGAYVHMDSPASGHAAGPTPMEMVLMSLAGCSGMDVVSILRKKHQPVDDFEVRVHGRRREDFPTIFTEIALEYIVHGPDVDPGAIERAIELSRDRYCPVWAMLGSSVLITSSFRVLSAEPVLSPGD
jgi:putative redox protein